MKKQINRLFEIIKNDDFLSPFTIYSCLTFIFLGATLGSALGYKYDGKTFFNALEGLWRGALGGGMIWFVMYYLFRLMNWSLSSILVPLWKRFSGWIILFFIIIVPLLLGILLSRFI
jgi:hypothetical protein